MDRNLEKNLRKIQSLREKGQLEKALKQLEDWARKNPDTPHYHYEAAMVALDLGDVNAGLRWLKSLLRAAPESRGKVLDAVEERYRRSPDQALGEFLVDRHLARGAVDEAFEVISLLGEEDLEAYRRKLELRHRGLEVAPAGSPPDLARAAFYTQLALARAQSRPEDFASLATALLKAVPEEGASAAALCEEELKAHPACGPLHAAAARAWLAAGDPTRAAGCLAAAAERDRPHAGELLEEMAGIEVDEEARGAWLRATAEVALAAGRGEEAADRFRQAADAEPTSRGEILARLKELPGHLDPALLAPLRKLQLRLLVVMRRYNELAPVIEALRKDEMVSAEELRALMGEGRGLGEKPVELAYLLAEAALRAGDLAAAAAHAAEIGDQDAHSLHKLINVIEALPAEEEDLDPLQLGALHAVLCSRLGQHGGANDVLRGLWEGEHDAAALCAVTESCLQRIHPSAGLLLSMLPVCLQEGRRDLLARALDGLLRHCAEDLRWLVDDLVAWLDEHPDAAGEILELLDESDRELGAAQMLRYPVACAALACGQVQRAVPEFQVLLMGRPQLAGEVLDRLKRALERAPEDAALNLAAFDLLWEGQDWEEAARCLSRALAADPGQIEALTDRFERLLRQAPQQAFLWTSYGEALFSVGRYAQLDELATRATVAPLDDEAKASLQLLAIRVRLEEGRGKEAVAEVEGLLAQGRLQPDQARPALERAVSLDPTLARAHLLLGRTSAALRDLDRAVAAFADAARADRGLAGEVGDNLDALAASPAATAAHLVEVAHFHRRFRGPAEAAVGYERALRLDPSRADRVLGDLAPVVEDPHAPVELLYVASRAARLGGRLEEACTLLTRVFSARPEEASKVLAELRRCADECEGEILPVRTMGQVLLALKRGEEAAAAVAEACEDPRYPESARREVLEEFHQRLPEHGGLLLALAAAEGRDGRRDEAARRLQEALARDGVDPDRARAVCAELLEEAPEHGELRLLHHDLLLHAGETEAAAAALPDPGALPRPRQEALAQRLAALQRRGLDRPELALRRAEALRRAGRREESLEVLRRSLEGAHGEDRVRVAGELARGLQHAGRSDQAQEVLDGLARDGLAWTEIYGMVGRWKSERRRRACAALRGRLEQDPHDAEARLRLASLLLEEERLDEAVEALEAAAGEGEIRLRRACLLADAHLRRERADRAEAVLRAVEADTEGFWSEEIGWRLAHCAQRRGRHAEATARYRLLMESSRYGERARRLAHEAYGRQLKDLAGEYRAVLAKVSSL